MPTVRKLAPEEVQTIENKGKGLRKLIEEQYDGFLAEYDTGEYGEAELSDGEKRLTVRNRLKAAAGRRGVAINFLRTTGSIIRFKIVPNDGQVAKQPIARKRTPAPEPEPAPSPAKRRGGRPRKSST
jgi:hypothetical protein